MAFVILRTSVEDLPMTFISNPLKLCDNMIDNKLEVGGAEPIVAQPSVLLKQWMK
jgi:hypothetical protein